MLVNDTCRWMVPVRETISRLSGVSEVIVDEMNATQYRNESSLLQDFNDSKLSFNYPKALSDA